MSRAPAYDVIVVGAGVVGSLVARALSRYRLCVLLLDQASDVGEGTTKANTAIVHAGYDAQPGTWKARLNVAGNALFDALSAELDFEFSRCGTYVVALDNDDLATLEALRARGRRNGVSGLEIIPGDEMRRREPEINPAVTGALYAPSGGLVDPFGMCVAAAESAVLNGVRLLLETRVVGLLREGPRVLGVQTDRGAFRAAWVVNAAGVQADVLRRQAGLEGFTITPRKGEYYVLDRTARAKVRQVLFPCPTPLSKGIMVTPTIHGNVLLGPNAQDVAARDDTASTSAGLTEVMAGALRLIPSLDAREVICTFAGLRATGSSGDFMLEIAPEAPGLLSLAGIESPGLTAAPALAEQAVEMLHEAGLRLDPRPDYRPERRGIPRFGRLDRAAQEALVAQDPRYAHVVCRCETVTEAEIVAAIHAPIPARTYDAIKRRTRVGTGRCQAGFDTPLVLEIMARELGVSPLELTKRGPGSEFLTRPTKEVTS